MKWEFYSTITRKASLHNMVADSNSEDKGKKVLSEVAVADLMREAMLCTVGCISVKSCRLRDSQSFQHAMKQPIFQET